MNSTNPMLDRMCFMPIGPTSDRPTDVIVCPEESEYQLFYTAYGECFSAWSSIELRLMAIYMFLLGSPEYKVASAAFYSTIGFRAKIDMVDAIVKNSNLVDDEGQKEWGLIRAKVSRQSKNRNKLAHNVIYFGRFSETENRRMFIAAPNTPSEGSQLHAHDLRGIKHSFNESDGELCSFWLKLVHLKQNKQCK
jgi:hypothetical protein